MLSDCSSGAGEALCPKSTEQLGLQHLSWLLLRGVCLSCQWFGKPASRLAARRRVKVFLAGCRLRKELLEWELQLWCTVCSEQLWAVAVL